MSKPRVLLDVDGVLADFCTPTLRALAEVGGPQWTVDDLKEWDFIGPLDPDIRRALFKHLHAPGFCDSLAMYPGSQEGVASLQAIADVYVVTSPMRSPTWTHEREGWLRRHFGIGHDRVIHTGAKHVCGGDFLIEDKAAALHEWRAHWPHGCGILIDRPYNREQWDGSLCLNWDQVIDEVSSTVPGKSEWGWVIEHELSKPGTPMYWSGRLCWSPDNLEACRFARQEDAERVRVSILGGHAHRVAEHGWSS